MKSLGDLLGEEQSDNLLVGDEEEDLGTIWCPDAHLGETKVPEQGSRSARLSPQSMTYYECMRSSVLEVRV